MISIIGKFGEVVVKIVAGCDGYNAEKLAFKLAELKTYELPTIYNIATSLNFGSKESLVVIGTDNEYHFTDDELPPSYRATFDCPYFNPRWKFGTAEHTFIIRELVSGWHVYKLEEILQN